MRDVLDVLANEGFLRDQGILTLEPVQKFYEIIEEKPAHASMRETELLDLCNQPGYNQPDYFPLIYLVRIGSKTDETLALPVILQSYCRYEDSLILTTTDSTSQVSEATITCPIIKSDGQQKLEIGGKKDQWCLGSDKCYDFYLNIQINFDKVIGRGASGTVVNGQWFGKNAAFKFVIKRFSISDRTPEILYNRTPEVESMNRCSGSRILKLYGNYR